VRWQFFDLAANTSRFRPAHWSLLLMGLRVDPGVFNPQRVLSRAWSRIRAGTPVLHSDMHPAAGDPLPGQTDSCVKG